MMTPPARIDAHQHFWRLARGDYGWLTPQMAAIYRDFLPADLTPILQVNGIGGTVLVQAADSVGETEFMLELAEKHSFIKGVVGWVDFAAADGAAQISALAQNPALVGLRPMIQDIAGDDWMLGDNLAPAFEALVAADLTFEALVLPRHLPYLRRLLARYPGMRTVIDHGAKPLIKDRITKGWWQDMAALAGETGAFCKLSGLVTEAGVGWVAADLRKYVDHLLEIFGPERLIWGSDWPVCTLATTYQDWLEVSKQLLSGLTDAGRGAVFGETAKRAYNLRQ